jgi:hypothetical protein
LHLSASPIALITVVALRRDTACELADWIRRRAHRVPVAGGWVMPLFVAEIARYGSAGAADSGLGMVFVTNSL